MSLSFEYAAAQLMYCKLATTLATDNRLAIQSRGHELIQKLCAEAPSRSDLLWLVNFGLWKLLDYGSKPSSLTAAQYESVLNIQSVWLTILDPAHKGFDKLPAHGAVELAHLF